MLSRACLTHGPRLSSRKASSWARHALYIDRAILVVNKPTGLVCQFKRQDDDSYEETGESLNDFIEDLKRRFELTTDPIPLHRLDKATTGSLAFALTPAHARDIAEQFRTHTVTKSYLALVRGGSASFPKQSGTIRGALYTNNGRVSVEGGERSEKRSIVETDWEVLATSPLVPISLVRLSPYTGYKHQLRVHMAKVTKTPVLGDTLYANAKLSPKITDVVNVPEDHMFLHASRLSVFRYLSEGPNKRLRMTFGAPLPHYFVRLCDHIKIPLQTDLIHGGLWIEGKRVPVGKAARARGVRSGESDSAQPDTSQDPQEENSQVGADPNGVDVAGFLQGLGGQWVGPGAAHVKPPPNSARPLRRK